MTNQRLLILGDSITAGCVETGVTSENAYPRLLSDALGENALGVEIVVSALHGVYADYAIRRFDRMVLRYRPNFVLIFLGANDAGPSGDRSPIAPEQFQADLTLLVTRCVEAGIAPCVASPIPCTSDRCDYPMIDYAVAARESARQCDVSYVELFEPFSQAGGVELLPDGLHPNPQGNIVIARTLSAALTRLLKTSIRGSLMAKEVL